MQIVRGVWMEVSAIIGTALGVIRGIIAVFADLIRGDWGAVWNDLKGIVSTVWEGITAQIAGFLTIITGLIGAAWDGVRGITNTAWGAIKNVVSTAIEAIIQFHRELPGHVVSALGDLASLLIGKGKDLIGGLFRGIVQVWGDVHTFLSGLGGKMVDAVGDTASKLFSAGYNLIAGFWSGIRSGVSNFLHSVHIPIPKVHIPGTNIDIGGGTITLAQGGIVKARPGGVLARIGEAGQDEAVIPLPRFGRSGAMSAAVAAGSGGVVINIYGHVLGDENAIARVIGPALRKGASNGFGRAA